MGSIALNDLPESLAKQLPRYSPAPIARLGRLAINLQHQGQKLGSLLLVDAIYRVAQSKIAAYAIAVDAKDSYEARFYQALWLYEAAAGPPNALPTA